MGRGGSGRGSGAGGVVEGVEGQLKAQGGGGDGPPQGQDRRARGGGHCRRKWGQMMS